jgi:anti-anti-sigma factor
MINYEFIKNDERPDVGIVELRGTLVEEPDQRYLDLIGEYQGKAVVLDLAKVNLMNSTGLTVIIGSYKRLREGGNPRLVLCNVSEKIMRKLDATHLNEVLKTFDSLEEALDSLD